MALEQRLNLKLAQKLVMTPTLQQAIKLLQLSRLELEQALAQELQVNPVLEILDEPSEAAEVRAAEGGPSQPEETPVSEEAGAAEEADPFAHIDVDELFGNFTHASGGRGESWDEEQPGLENSAAPPASMFDALMEQLRLQSVPDRLRPVCEFIIGNLEPDGYLRLALEDLANQLGADLELLEEALSLVQCLEPAGIAARNLQECFLLQLKRFPRAVDAALLARTRQIVSEAFDALLHQRWDRITRPLGVTTDDIRGVLDVLRRLDPRPGLQLGPSENSVIEPDVTVRKNGDTWQATLNDDGLPHLRLSPRYLSMLRSRSADKETTGYLRERMRAALWFLRSVDQRQNTILKVADAIVRRQRDFLERGLPYLKPLVLRDIADDIGMHESTVSRVVSNKYVDTPRGIYPFKFFFHSAISHAVDGDISSVVVKERIRELIAAEDPRRPLSDARVARQLNRLGIRIARRTVAKYREELNIPSSEHRRRALR